MKKSRSPALLITSLAVFCALLGCGGGGYKGKAYYKPLSSSKPVLGPYSLGVLPVEDNRGNKQEEEQDKRVYTMIPLIPYWTIVRERPENLHQDDLDIIKSVQADYIRRGKPLSDSDMDVLHRMWAYGYPPNFSAPPFLQGSLVKEFEHSRMFDQVIAVQSPQDLNQTDFVLKPTLLSSKVSDWGTAYMLSIPGFLIGGLLGLPVQGLSLELDLKLEFFQAGQGKPIWTGRVYEKEKGRSSPYYQTGFAKYGAGSDHHGQPLNELLSKGMAKATPALYDFLKKQPPEFWQELEHNRSQWAAEPRQEEAAPQQPQKSPSSMQDYIKQFQQEIQEE